MKFYNEIFGKLYRESETSTEEIFNNRKKRGVILYEYLEKNCDVAKIKNVLEIGCADGGILAGLISCGMKNCKGIDLGSKFLDFGKSKGLDLECCHSKELLARNEKYDLIILSHVFEHFLDIKSELAVIHKLLSDDGLFYVEVPGIKNVVPAGAYWGNWLAYFQNAHVRHFCKDTLSQVMRWNGFEEVIADEEIKSIYRAVEKSSEKITVNNYFDSILSHLQTVENKYLQVGKYLEQEKNLNSDSPTLTHVTFPFAGNLGDTVLSYCVRRTFDNLNHKNFSYFLLNLHKPVEEGNILEKMNATKGIIIGGGGIFLPDTNENNITGWQWDVSKETLKKIIPPVILYSIGYNYFRGQKPSELFIENLNVIVEKASFIGLRNTGSVKKIQSLVKDELRNKIVFQPCTTTIIRKIISDLPKKIPTKKVAINMAFDRANMRFGENKNLILSQIADAVKKIQNFGYEIYFIQHCKIDAEFVSYLDAAGVDYKNIDAVAWLPKECFEFYNETDLVLGMRGHAQMIPFGLNTKIISLASRDKLGWFLEDIDSLDWLIELNENPVNLSERIFDKFVEVQSDKNIYERLIEQQNKLYRITLENNEQIKNILNL